MKRLIKNKRFLHQTKHDVDFISIILKSQLSIVFSEEEKIRHGLLADESLDAIAHLRKSFMSFELV